MATARGRGWAGFALATAVISAVGCSGGHTASTDKATTSSIPGTATTAASPLTPPTSAPGSGQTTTTPSTTHPVPTTPPAATTATPAVQQAALTRLVAAYPPKSSVSSEIVHTGALTYVAVAHDDGGRSALIDIYAYRGSTFVDVAANLGSNQHLDLVRPTTIRTGNVTGGPFPDFLVPLAAGDHDNGVLVSSVRGRWQLIGVSERTGAAASAELVEPNIVGNKVTQSVNDCSSNCARGNYAVTTYLFDPKQAKLVASGPTISSPHA